MSSEVDGASIATLVGDSDEVEVEVGMVVTDDRSDEDILYRVVYADDWRVLLRSNTTNRVGQRHYRTDVRDTFEEYLATGRYKRVPDGPDAPSMPSEQAGEEVDWGQVDGVGEKTATRLREAGIKTDLDLLQTDDDKILEVYGVSENTLERLEAHVED